MEIKATGIGASDRERPFVSRPSVRRVPGLRVHLVVLVVAVLLPALALGGATAWHLADNYRRAFEERLSDTARALALAADAEIRAVIAAIETLAASPLLDDPLNLPAFEAQARRVGDAFGSWVVVTRGRDMRQLVNTRLPPGAALPGAASPAVIIDALGREGPTVRDLVTLPFRPEPVVAVLAPVLRDRQPQGLVLVMPLDTARMRGLLQAQALEGAAFATLVDRRNTVVARSRDHERYVGRTAPEWFAAATSGQASGRAAGPDLDGRKALVAFQRLSAAPGWTVAVAEPWAAYQASWKDPLLGLGLGALAVLALALALAAALAGRLVRPATSLLRRAEAVAAGASAPPTEPSVVAEFEALRAAIERADAALREGEADFRAAFEQSAVAMVQTDCSTARYARVNDAFCGLLGRRPDELLGRPFADFAHPDDREAHLAAFWRVARGEAASYETIKRFLLPDGSTRWARVSSSPVRDGSGQAIRTVAVVQDITEGRAAAAALRASEAEFRAAFEQAAIAMSQVDAATGRLLRVNPAYCRLLGRAAGELIGHPFSEFVHPEDQAADLEGFLRMTRGEDPTHSAVKRYVRPDGTVRWAELVSSPVRDAEGRVERTVAIVLDITDRRAAEERQALLAREVDHRSKNALAVVQAALRLTPKDDAEAYARAVEGRVSALARAHTLLAGGRWKGAGLRDLCEAELSAFLSSGEAGAAPRVEIGGPSVTLAPGAAQAFSMALHELATNATKYGALSSPDGHVQVRWSVVSEAGTLRLRWVEIGGPAIDMAPTRRGFGSRVIEATVRDQLGGTVARHWEQAGLVCEINVPLGRIEPN